MSAPRDGYSAYFTEKLWEWVPAHHRELDALEGGDVLRALMRAVASQAAEAKRSQDRLWDDMFVELADDWAIPYIAELVGTRLVSALNPRARRADVAKTIYYRRRKGTLAVLEQLIVDMSGWDGRVQEQFRRLARARHGLDGPALTGRLTGTPEGGLADLRSVRGARLTNDPFDEFHHLPEMRRPRGRLGLHAISTLAVHLYRLSSVAFVGVTPRRMRNPLGGFDGFCFDPSGRDVPLFSGNGVRSDWSSWRSAEEWALPRAIDCRLLGEAVFVVGDRAVAWVRSDAPLAGPAQREAAADDLRKLTGQRFADRDRLRRVLTGLPQGAALTAAGVFNELQRLCLVDDCGSAALLPGADGQSTLGPPAVAVQWVNQSPVDRADTRSADLSAWTVQSPSAIRLCIDPARGRFIHDISGHFPRDLRVRYRVGMALPVGAGAWNRDLDNRPADTTWQDGQATGGTPVQGIAHIRDSATYRNPPDQSAVVDTTVRAAEGQRPYIRLMNHWRLSASGVQRHLTLDGLWIGGRPYGNVWLFGDYEEVRLRHVTLDPGGTDANGQALSPCELVVHGVVEHLVIEHSVLCTVRLQGTGANLQRITLADCIVDASQPGMRGIAAPRAELRMDRCTVIGNTLHSLALDVERLQATDSLIAARADVTDVQSGCFRFGAHGPLSRLPRPYESHTLQDLPGVFASRRFGHPHYASLSEGAPAALRTGSEQGSHIGAGCAAMAPIKFDSLRSKLDEYMPFGRLPAFLIEN